MPYAEIGVSFLSTIAALVYYCVGSEVVCLLNLDIFEIL